jgi:hypothetical protein
VPPVANRLLASLATGARRLMVGGLDGSTGYTSARAAGRSLLKVVPTSIIYVVIITILLPRIHAS